VGYIFFEWGVYHLLSSHALFKVQKRDGKSMADPFGNDGYPRINLPDLGMVRDGLQPP